MTAYTPKETEEKWYPFWEQGNFFHADSSSSKPPYCISIPPPNVTGVLHMGHALVDTLQDVLVRWKRMGGYEALWVPGTDHAGIATQTVVERDQMAKTGKRRKDFSREEFVELIWSWKEKSEKQIIQQIKRLGCSCDWSRLAFTMDEPRSQAVRTLFVKMFEEGLIYRGDYLVNWDPVTQTALADDEVEYEERESYLWHIRYPFADNSGYIIIATTRPETMLGDTAVAVNPKDERYRNEIGKLIRLPLSGRLVPLIGDEFVTPEFGTGAVKITPAHDPNDYEMAQRQGLPMLNIMTPDGRINEEGGEFCGLSMAEAREAVCRKLKEMGHLEKAEPHRNRVGVSYRSKAVIEPYLSKQWFVKMSSFKKKLIDAVKEKRVKITPSDWESTYFHWIENLRDWCISRQLWWGHRIPIWYNKEDPSRMICFAGEGVPPEVAKNPEKWHQDEDVLDTWFSSALWPLSVLGWPNQTEDFKTFYPNSVLVTGHDILFFWVARMLVMGEYTTGTLPFPETFLHGLIFGRSYWRYNKDGSVAYVDPKERLGYELGEPIPKEVHAKWEKMSKSKGNTIDPIEIIETYGTDAMRIALCSITTHARQIDLDRRKFEEYKNFINKIWNGARFVFQNIETMTKVELSKGIDPKLLSLEDKWILSRLNGCIERVDAHLSSYYFDRTAQEIYHFFWDEFCAYYIELVKPTLFGKVGTREQKENKQKILAVCLGAIIRLFHPIIPFITEELFEKLKGLFPGSGNSKDPYVNELLKALSSPACIVAPFPTVIDPLAISKEVEEGFSQVGEVITAIRTIRAEMQLSPGVECALHVVGEETPLMRLLRENQGMVSALIRLSSITFGKKGPEKGLLATAHVSNLRLIVPLPEEMREKERLRLHKNRDKLIDQQRQLAGKLGNESFVSRAPKELVDSTKQLLSQTEVELTEVGKKLEQLAE